MAGEKTAVRVEHKKRKGRLATFGITAFAVMILVLSSGKPTDQTLAKPGPLPTPSAEIIPTTAPKPTKIIIQPTLLSHSNSVEQNQPDQTGPIAVSLGVVGVVIGGLYWSSRQRHSGDFIDREDNPDLAKANADQRKDWETKHSKDDSPQARQIREKFAMLDRTANKRVGGRVVSARLKDGTFQTEGQVVRQKTWLGNMISTLSGVLGRSTKP